MKKYLEAVEDFSNHPDPHSAPPVQKPTLVEHEDLVRLSPGSDIEAALASRYSWTKRAELRLLNTRHRDANK
jgi:hypothetical protein